MGSRLWPTDCTHILTSLVVLPTYSTLQNFRTIGQGVFVRLVPENRMFPQQSEVVRNTGLSANALARDLSPTNLQLLELRGFILPAFRSMM
jgi:hypothetical protein